MIDCEAVSGVSFQTGCAGAGKYSPRLSCGSAVSASVQLRLDFRHFVLVQVVPAHGDDGGDVAQNRHDAEADHDRHVEGGVHRLVGFNHHVTHARQGQREALDHGGEGGNDLVDEGEHGSHHAGNEPAAAVGLVVRAVRDHGDDSGVTHAGQAFLYQEQGQEHGGDLRVGADDEHDGQHDHGTPGAHQKGAL